MRVERSWPGPQAIIGLAILIWGLLLTAANFGWIDRRLVHQILPYWPLILVAVGVATLVGGRCRGDRIGWVLIVAGLWLLLGTGRLFPLLLMIIGVLLIKRARPVAAWARAAGADAPAESDGLASEFAFWSSIDRRITDREFSGRRLTAVMGAIKLDFREATVSAGGAVLDLLVVMGGVEIIVPPDWRVVNEVTPVLGGVDDRSSGGAAGQQTLVIRGTIIMGGVEIKT